ncbi:MAG: hypothetical protein IT376_07035 [Polyangiaceae bacterium]|nr:hypothetical protein [Polyangiaceae bacterium]
MPAVPASCDAFATTPPATCTADGEAFRGALADALATADAAARDTALAALEPCAALPPGAVRALRAEVAPTECGDALVQGVLAAPPARLRDDVRSVLEGLGLAARLARLVREPPRLAPPFDKQRFRAFFEERLAPWVAAQAGAIYELSSAGARLGGYGKGIVAVEAGLADLRFVEEVRNVPLPVEITKDRELADVYFGALDEALDPRKDRGRDAALAGLRLLASAGVIRDARVDRARSLLSKLYGGRRIDRLDALALPPLGPVDTTTPDRRLATLLPTFYAGLTFAATSPPDAPLLRALLERGVPPELARQLDASALPEATRRLWARAHVEMGRTYWRSRDFARAAELAQLGAAGSGAAADDATLLSALAQALAKGPADAVEMMAKGPMLPAALGDVTALDALAKRRSPLSGIAAYDAAFLLELAPPEAPDAGYWEGVAERYEQAAKLLRADATLSRRALDRATAARSTARALGAPGAGAPRPAPPKPPGPSTGAPASPRP